MKIYFDSQYNLKQFSEILSYLNAQCFVDSIDNNGYYERCRIREIPIELRVIQSSYNSNMNFYLEKVKGFCDLLMDLNG